MPRLSQTMPTTVTGVSSFRWTAPLFWAQPPLEHLLSCAVVRLSSSCSLTRRRPSFPSLTAEETFPIPDRTRTPSLKRSIGMEDEALGEDDCENILIDGVEELVFLRGDRKAV